MRTECRRVVIGETCIDATVEPGYVRMVDGLAAEARAEVKAKMLCDPFFGTTYGPCPESPGDPLSVRRMCRASVASGVGPMAAVAGAVALHVAEGLMAAGCRTAVIDNGGDIAMFSDGPLLVRILPDPGGQPTGLVVDRPGIVGISSSSGRNGHSVSLGESDICTVVSQDPVLADACATLLGNIVGHDADLADAVEEVSSIPGVEGCLACVGDATAVCGDFPEMVPLD